MTIVNISWERIPFDEQHIKDLNKETDFGIYQIYGRHNAYGKDALLYIGKAQDQCFAARLNARWEFIESSATPHTIRIGRLMESSVANEQLEWNRKDWKRLINLCEELLIITHTPAFNKKMNSGLADHKTLTNNIHIMNWGDFGDLLPELSTLRYSYKYWTYENPVK